MNSTYMMNAQRKTTRVSIALIFAVFAVLFLHGCETTTHGQEGEVLGGVLGGLLGAQVGDGRGKTAAIIVGTIAGSMIGRHIGESMDDTDRTKTALVLSDGRTGDSTNWVNPDTSHRYTVTSTRTYEKTSGPCREFRLDATVGNQKNQDVYDTACLQADGSWLVQQEWIIDP